MAHNFIALRDLSDDIAKVIAPGRKTPGQMFRRWFGIDAGEPRA